MRSFLSLFFVAPGVGAVAAVAGIAFIEYSLSLYRYAVAASAAWVLALPIIAGALIAQLGKLLPRRLYLGLADMALFSQRAIRPRHLHNFLSSLLSFVALAGGLSVGIYGPIAHLGGSLGSLCHFHLPPKVTAACGIAAAISAAFNAPITGLIFAHELILRHYSIRTLTPVTLSAVVGYLISAGVFNRPIFLSIADMPTLPLLALPLFIGIGVLFGVLARVYLRIIFAVNAGVKKFADDYKLPIVGAISGCIVLALPDLAAGDKNLMSAALDGIPVALAVALLIGKVVATWLCIGSGFPGGIISPTLATGALTGIIIAHAVAAASAAFGVALEVPSSAIVLCAMMAMVAPVIGAPLTAVLFVLELSGNYPLTIVAAVSITIAAQTAAKLGARNYYEMQLAQRGYDLRQRQDEWILHKTHMRDLAKPAAVVCAPIATARQAIALAAANNATDIFICPLDKQLIAHLRLPDLLRSDSDARLADIVPAAALITLDADDSVATATEKTANFRGDTVPVVQSGALIGVISESQLLTFHHRQVRQYRQEETAI